MAHMHYAQPLTTLSAIMLVIANVKYTNRWRLLTTALAVRSASTKACQDRQHLGRAPSGGPNGVSPNLEVPVQMPARCSWRTYLGPDWARTADDRCRGGWPKVAKRRIHGLMHGPKSETAACNIVISSNGSYQRDLHRFCSQVVAWNAAAPRLLM